MKKANNKLNFVVEVYDDKNKTYLLHRAKFNNLREAKRYSKAYEFFKLINEETNKVLSER